MDSEAKGGGGRGGGGRLSTRAAAALATQHSRGGKVVGAIGEAASRWERAAANGTAIKRNAEGCEPARCASHSPRHLAPTGPPGAACKRCECWPARAPSDLQADGRARACKVSSGGGAMGCATAIRRRQLHRGRPPPPPCVGMPCCGLHLALNSSHIRLPKRRMSMPVPLKDWEKNRCYVRSGRKAGDTTLGNGRGHGRRCGVAQERAGMVGKSSVPRIALVHLSIAPRGRLHGGSRPWHVPACSQGQRRLARVNGRQLTASRARKFATQADRGAEAQSKTTASGLHSQLSYGYAQSTYWQRAWGGRTGRWTMRSCPPRRSTSTAPHL